MTAPVLFVTGKGGTGKSAVAEALAKEAAGRGRSVLLIRMQPSAERGASSPIGRSPAGGGPAANLPRERNLDDRADLEAFLTRVLGLGVIARRLGESRTFSAVAAAAPGLRDLVALCAVFEEASRQAQPAHEATRRSKPRGQATDQRALVVVDAPATGHSVPMLTAPAQALQRAPVGPVAREASRALAVLADPHAFAAVLVTTPEELAITEVAELRAQVTAAGVSVARVVVNALWPAYVPVADGDRIAASGASADAAMHWRRHRRQAALVEELELGIGPCPRIGFAFGAGELPVSDVAALLDSLPGGSA